MLIALVGWFSRNSILHSVVKPAIDASISGESELRGLRWTGFWAIGFDDLLIRVNDWEGPAAEVLQIEGMQASLRFWPLLFGEVEFKHIDIDRVKIRIAEKADDPGSINLASLMSPSEPDQESLGPKIGFMEINNLDIEVGVAEKDRYTVTATEEFNVRIEPIDLRENLHSFVMAQRNLDTDVPTLIKGWWNPNTMAFDLRLDDLNLTSGSALAMSASAREFCNRIHLTGEIEYATVSWQPGIEPRAELKVKSIGMTMPDELGLDQHWVRFHNGAIIDESPPPPRMEIREGTIELNGNQIAFRSFSGQLVPADGNPDIPAVKIRLDFEAHLGTELKEATSIDAISDWGREILASAPFELELTISEFIQELNENGDSSADLPRSIAKALANLQATEWNLAAVATAKRGSLDKSKPAPTDEPMAINTTAKVYLAGGRGAYIGFPYPLRNVSAQVLVENDDVTIDHLVGRGPHGHTLAIEGLLIGTDDDAGVNLTVHAAQIPIDEYLFQALPRSTQAAVRRLFDPLANERLEKAGLLVDEKDVESARNNLQQIRTAIRQAELDGDMESLEDYRDAARRLDVLIAAGEFDLGGLASIDLHVHRERGENLRLVVEGTLDLVRVGAVFDQFPYPLIVTSGQIQLEDEAIIISEPGIAITTPTGGNGRINGRIDVPRDPAGGRKMIPDLSIVITDDLVNPALLAAVPPSGEGRVTSSNTEGWPGTVLSDSVRPLMELGISGSIDCHARVQNNSAGETEVRASVLLRDGQLVPSRSLENITTAGRGWPSGMELESCEAILLIEPDTVSLRKFRGYRGEGVVTANGTFDRTDDTAIGRIDFENIAIEPYMKEMFSEEAQPVVEELHSTWQPYGTIDGSFDWSQTNNVNKNRFTLRPQEVTFHVGDRDQTLNRERGEIIIVDGVVQVEDLVVKTNFDKSNLQLRGSIALEPSTLDHRLDVDFSEMTFAAPMIEEALRLSAGNSFGASWHQHAPEGVFHGAMSIETSPSDHVELAVVPTRFTMLANPEDPESRAGGDIEPGAMIEYNDGNLHIGPLLVHGNDDSLLDIEAQATNLTETPMASANWRLRATTSRIPETQFLPPPLSLIIGEEGIATGPLDAKGTLEMEFQSGKELPRIFDSTAYLEFTEGTIDLGGVVVDGMEGNTELRIRMADEVVEILEGQSDFPRALIENRLLKDIQIKTALAPPSGGDFAVNLTMTEGSLYGGPVRGEFRFEPNTDRYRLNLFMDDVALSGLVSGENDEQNTTPGRVLASLALEGITGDTDSRIGRGEIRIRDANIADKTGSMALLRIGQLMLPGFDGLNEVEISYLIDRGEAILSRILLESSTLQLSGKGRLRFSDFSLAARLLPKGQLGAFSDVVSAVTGTVYAIDVEGTPANPKASLTPLPIVVSAPKLTPVDPEDTNEPNNEKLKPESE